MERAKRIFAGLFDIHESLHYQTLFDSIAYFDFASRRHRSSGSSVLTRWRRNQSKAGSGHETNHTRAESEVEDEISSKISSVVRDRTFSSAGLIPWNTCHRSPDGHDGLMCTPTQMIVRCLLCLGPIDACSGTTSQPGDIPISIRTCGVTLSGILMPKACIINEPGGMPMVRDMKLELQGHSSGSGQRSRSGNTVRHCGQGTISWMIKHRQHVALPIA
jgi:hypothetical protein